MVPAFDTISQLFFTALKISKNYIIPLPSGKNFSPPNLNFSICNTDLKLAHVVSKRAKSGLKYFDFAANFRTSYCREGIIISSRRGGGEEIRGMSLFPKIGILTPNGSTSNARKYFDISLISDKFD